MAARRWVGIRRPTEELAIRRLEKRRNQPTDQPTAEWWRKWNELDGGEWARERADEDEKARRLLRVFFMTNGEDDETEKARRLARALGLLDGGDR